MNGSTDDKLGLRVLTSDTAHIMAALGDRVYVHWVSSQRYCDCS